MRTTTANTAVERNFGKHTVEFPRVLFGNPESFLEHWLSIPKYRNEMFQERKTVAVSLTVAQVVWLPLLSQNPLVKGTLIQYFVLQQKSKVCFSCLSVWRYVFHWWSCQHSLLSWLKQSKVLRNSWCVFSIEANFPFSICLTAFLQPCWWNEMQSGGSSESSCQSPPLKLRPKVCNPRPQSHTWLFCPSTVALLLKENKIVALNIPNYLVSIHLHWIG